MRKTVMLPLLAMAALLVAILAATSPASAASSAAKPSPSSKPTPPPPPPSSGATFIKAYSDGTPNGNQAFGDDVFPTSDGGSIVTGSFGTPPNGWVAKLSAAGQVQWQEQLGTGQTGFASVQQTTDGGYILAGGTSNEPGCATQAVGTDCAWVVKLSSAGAVQWQQAYSGAQRADAQQIRQISDGGFIVAGNTTDSTGTEFAWLAKLSPTGALVWQKQFGPASFAAAFSVAQTPDGGFITSGNSGVINSSSVLVAKFDATGAIQWQKTYGTSYFNNGNSVLPTSDGGYIVGGEHVVEKPDASTPSEALLLKLSPAGDIQFQDVFNAGTTFDALDMPIMLSSSATAVAVAGDGGFILAGTSDSTGPTASWLVKTTSTGALSWQHIFVGPTHSEFNSMQLTSDGSIIAAGETGDFRNEDSVWVVKADSSGNVAGGSCTDQHNSTTTEQTGPLTATTTTFASVTPVNNPIAVTAETPSTTSLLTESVC